MIHFSLVHCHAHFRRSEHHGVSARGSFALGRPKEPIVETEDRESGGLRGPVYQKALER